MSVGILKKKQTYRFVFGENWMVKSKWFQISTAHVNWKVLSLTCHSMMYEYEKTKTYMVLLTGRKAFILYDTISFHTIMDLWKKMHTKRNIKQLIFTWGQWKFPRNILQHSILNRTHKMTVTGRQTLGNGVFSIFGFIPTDVVFARIIPSSGWKFSNSARLIASPPTLLASCLALSSSHKKTKKFTKLASRLNQCSSQKANTGWKRKNDKCSPK